MDFSKMTDEELDVYSIGVQNKKDELMTELFQINAERDVRHHAKEAARKVSLMSDSERAALLQVLQAGPVDTGAVGAQK